MRAAGERIGKRKAHFHRADPRLAGVARSPPGFFGGDIDAGL